MLMNLIDLPKKAAMVLGEAVRSFRGNNDLALASSMAFSAMLALIPALFLLTSLLGMAIGSSQDAISKVQELVRQVIPSYSEEVLKEVRYIAQHKRTFGALNFIVFLLVVTPLVSDLRAALGAIFRTKRTRNFLLEKLIDLGITVVFLLAIAAVALAGVALTVAERHVRLPELPHYFGGFVQFLFIAGTMSLLYAVFSRKTRFWHLASGAVAAAGLWFLMRPLFHSFLSYNPGYGFAFGSFKSLFVVIIWIYYSLVVFLAGAEIAAVIGRRETVYLRQLLAGTGTVPDSFLGRFVHRYEEGTVIFPEGGEGREMYLLRQGSVAIRKGDRDIAVVRQGKFFGQLSFLLDTPRMAAAVALEDVELIAVSDRNISILMSEVPELAVEMLKDLAARLRSMEQQVE